jgi:NDP-sugar pyrophosphorylase family protein
MKLLILAAGLGSRFGGVKQLASVGPAGESLPEYNIFDALRAGFSGVVLLIRRGMEEDVKRALVSRLPGDLKLEFAFQDSEAFIPDTFKKDIGRAGRQKPWGTGQALLCARELLEDSPFAVINGDDFYGRLGFASVKRFFDGEREKTLPEFCLAGYRLKGVVPSRGSVSRAVCSVDSQGRLLEIREHKSVERRGESIISVGQEATGEILDPEVLISMNMWGLDPRVFPWVEEGFAEFLADPGHWASSEFYLPEAMGSIAASGKAAFRVLPVDERYFGLTNPEDLKDARKAALERFETGEYPSPLWGGNPGGAGK